MQSEYKKILNWNIHEFLWPFQQLIYIREGFKSVKSVFLPLKIQKKDKTTFRQAKFCLLRCNNGRYTQNFVYNTRNFSLDMVLSP